MGLAVRLVRVIVVASERGRPNQWREKPSVGVVVQRGLDARRPMVVLVVVLMVAKVRVWGPVEMGLGQGQLVLQQVSEKVVLLTTTAITIVWQVSSTVLVYNVSSAVRGTEVTVTQYR